MVRAASTEGGISMQITKDQRVQILQSGVHHLKIGQVVANITTFPFCEKKMKRKRTQSTIVYIEDFGLATFKTSKLKLH